jgi:hypothetical protein
MLINYLNWLVVVDDVFLVLVFIALQRLSQRHEIILKDFKLLMDTVLVVRKRVCGFRHKLNVTICVIVQRLTFDFEHVESDGGVSRILVVDVEIVGFIGIVFGRNIHNLKLGLQNFISLY